MKIKNLFIFKPSPRFTSNGYDKVMSYHIAIWLTPSWPKILAANELSRYLKKNSTKFILTSKNFYHQNFWVL